MGLEELRVRCWEQQCKEEYAKAFENMIIEEDETSDVKQMWEH